MIMMDVISPLSMDTNVVVVGEPVMISLVITTQEDVNKDNQIPITAVSYPSSAEVGVMEMRGRSEANVDSCGWEDMTEIERVHDNASTNFLVTFLPREAVQYSFEVKHNDKHVSGSPFSIVGVSPAEIKQQSSQEQSVAAGESVTFAIPMSWNYRAVSPTVLVGGPHGQCEVFNKSSNGSVSFFPNQPGDYIISLLSKDGIRAEKYHINAKISDMGASRCYVFQSDMTVFQNPIRFTEGCKVAFRVDTSLAYGMGLLRVVAKGPSEANVIVSDTISGEEESIVFQPSSPGKYSLDVLWGGHHIQDSPFPLHFRKPRSPVECSGLDLAKDVLVVGIPFCFKLSCKEAEEGDIEVYCVPPSAASIKISPARGTDTHLCEIIPRECGTHHVSVQLQGIHITGSPFPVQFRHRGDAKQCRVEGELQQIQNRPSIKFYVNTAQAGEGKLTAVAIDNVSKEKMIGAVNELDEGRHMVEFTPGRGMECKLGVLYDGHHIHGSPFPLLFPGAASFSVQGDGLIRATVNRWSLFSVHSVNAGPGVFSVSIEGPENMNVVPTITSKGSTAFDVRYLPSLEGEYLVFLRWGQHQIPGSPFTVRCFNAESLSHFTIWKPSNRIPYSTPIEFTVEDCRTEREKLRDNSSLCVEAKAQQSSKVITAVTSRDNDGNIYCQFDPPDPGNYTVTVSCRGVELPESPFKVTIPSPPRAERVRVWGEGLQDHHLSCNGSASKFMVDTIDAGSGVLGIKVSHVCMHATIFGDNNEGFPSFTHVCIVCSTRYMDLGESLI